VTVEDRLVMLRNVHGQTANGTISLPKADLDFRQPVYDLTFPEIGVTRVDLRKLPSSWKVPKLPYPLTGKAMLQVLITDGHARTTGEGNGVLEITLFLRQGIRMTVEENRFHFHLQAATKDRP
jgi:hypothetical protein